MKSWKYYLKSSDRLFAMTNIKELADEFEMVYDMSKFYKMTEEWDSKKDYDFETGLHGNYKLWIYTMHTKDNDVKGCKNSFNICMTKSMHDAIEKAGKNIVYSFKSAYIACMKLRETEGFPISDEYLGSLHAISYNTESDYTAPNLHMKFFRIDYYKIWLDIYGDIINLKDDDKKSSDTSIAASRILGIYKYDYPEVTDIDNSSMYESCMISMDIFGNRI